MPDAVIAQLFAIAFLHVFPHCAVGIAVGDEHRWTGNSQEVDAEVFYRTLDVFPDASRADEMKIARDIALEKRVMAFRSRRYPRVKIFYAQCLRHR